MIARKAQVKLLKEHKKFSNVPFDNLQTFEHTKLKPLAIGLIVETKTRFVMGMRVSTQPSNGNLTKNTCAMLRDRLAFPISSKLENRKRNH
jgi:hypothetical protein